MNRFPVIIDCDPGVDDAVAILLAKQLPELDVRAITAVAGNVEVEKTYANAHKILHVAKWDVPVFMGAAKPLIGAQITAAGIHGVDGLGGVDVPGTVIPPAPQEAAWDAIYREAVAAKGELVLIAVGPLTNLAIAFGKYRALPELIKRIVIMGGAATLGNTTPAAEFNIYADPEAAEMVFQSGVPVHMVEVINKATRCNRKLVQELAEVTNAPIVTTLPARGVVPDSDPKVLGMLGMHGTIAATGAVQRCDLLVAIGARFDDRVTGKLDAFAPGARVIHIDIDPAEIGKNRQPDVPIVGDVATVLKDLIPEIKREQAVHGKPDTSHWWDVINKWREEYPITWDEPTDGSLAPQWVVKQLSDMADPNTVWVSGVGQHQMWATQIIEFNKPHSWLSSGGLGTMGFGLPAAMGAQLYYGRDRRVIHVAGDGGIKMTGNEFYTIARLQLPIISLIVNNRSLGMIRQLQKVMYKERYIACELDYPMDYVKYAACFGIEAEAVSTQDEFAEAIRKALEDRDHPRVIVLNVWRSFVEPMTKGGARIDEFVEFK